MKRGLYEIEPRGSGNILWVDGRGMVINGAYYVSYRATDDSVGICPKNHPHAARDLPWRAHFVGEPLSRSGDYNHVINEFLANRKDNP